MLMVFCSKAQQAATIALFGSPLSRRSGSGKVAPESGRSTHRDPSDAVRTISKRSAEPSSVTR